MEISLHTPLITSLTVSYLEKRTLSSHLDFQTNRYVKQIEALYGQFNRAQQLTIKMSSV